MLSLDSIPLQQRSLAQALAAGEAAARRDGARKLVSVTQPFPRIDPVSIVQSAERAALDYVCWIVPQQGFALVGLGEAAAVEGEGTARFAHVRDAWRRLLDGAHVENPSGAPGTGPVLAGGFAFDPLAGRSGLWDGFPDARLVLPRVTYALSGAQAWLTHNVWAEPGGIGDGLENGSLEEAVHAAAGLTVAGEAAGRLQVDQDEKANWLVRVRAMTDLLSAGPLQKVVLARAVTGRADRAPSVAAALARLRRAYPDCFLFAFRRGERTFLGATPERLVRVDRGTVQTMCLAGSIRRGITPEEDAALGAALLANAKERREHQLVLEMIRGELGPVCEELVHPPEPALLKLGNVQHLYTPLGARMKDGYTVFDVIARLHPTPAVGGSPRELALAAIRTREGLDRGWYAGPVGWVDARCDGEFAVALRSALLHGSRATLFAGCGIMPDSDPESEYAESCLKLRPMLQALGGQP